jgi:hypothetical protein
MEKPKVKDMLILIGGASGIGKTRLANELDDQGSAVYRKLHDVALGIVQGMNLDPITAISQMDDSVVIQRMIELAKQYYCLVTDVHYAIQPITDTEILVKGNVLNNKLAKTETYIPAFKISDLRSVMDSGLNLLPILLTCNTDTLLQRRLNNTIRTPRSVDEGEIKAECDSEMTIYLSTMAQLGLPPQIFINEDNKFNNLKIAVASLVKSKRY